MGVDLSIVWAGMTHAFTVLNLMWLVFGVTLGLVAGTLPGLGSGAVMALLLPIVVTLPVDTMLIALAGIYAANIYADSTTGILYNIPGNAAGIPATIEGYKLNLQGRLQEAFAAQVGGAFFGALVGFLVLLVLVPSLIYFVKFFGSAERALLSTWALVFISSGAVTKENPVQSFLSVGVGLALALIGQQPNIGTFRFTLGLPGLWDGVKVVVLVLGIFAIPQLLSMVRLREALGQQAVQTGTIGFISLYRSMLRILWEGRNIVLRTSLSGAMIGVIPGIGPATAAWVGYSIARSKTKQPQKFGEGNRDGVLGPESAGNACEVGTIVPLLALGIPGGPASAIMLGGLNMVGMYPGPSMYATYGVQVWTVMFGIGLSGVAFTVLAFPFIRGAQILARAPVSVLIAAIGTVCFLGAYLQTNDTFSIAAMLIFGIIMLAGTAIGLRPAPLLIGFVLGPGIEKELIRGYQIGGFERFLQPASMVILAVIAFTLALAIYRTIQNWRVPAAIRNADIFPNARQGLRDRVLGIVGLLVAATLMGASIAYPLLARLWVYFVAGGFLMIPSLVLIKSSFGQVDMPTNAAGRPPNAAKWRKLLRDQIILAALFGVFYFMIDPLGFIVSTVIFVFALVFYIDRRVLLATLAAVGVTGLIWLMRMGFGFYLPTGFLDI